MTMRLFNRIVLMVAALPTTQAGRTAMANHCRTQRRTRIIANFIGGVKLKNDRNVEGDA